MSGRRQAKVFAAISLLTLITLGAYVAWVGVSIASQWAGVAGLGLTVVSTALAVQGTVRERRSAPMAEPPHGHRVADSTVDGHVLQINDIRGNLHIGKTPAARPPADRADRTDVQRVGPENLSSGPGHTVSNANIHGSVNQIGSINGDTDVDP